MSKMSKLSTTSDERIVPKNPATVPQALILAFLAADPAHEIGAYTDYRIAEYRKAGEKLPIGAPNPAALKACAAKGWVAYETHAPGTGWSMGGVGITPAGRAALAEAARYIGPAFAEAERGFRTGLACTLASRDEQVARAALRRSSEELGAAVAALDAVTRERVRLAIECIPGIETIRIGTLLKLHSEAADAHRAAEAAREIACTTPAPERDFAAQDGAQDGAQDQPPTNAEVLRDGEAVDDWPCDVDPATGEAASNAGGERVVRYRGVEYLLVTDHAGEVVHRADQPATPRGGEPRD